MSADPCPNVTRCPLFPHLKRQWALAVWVDAYCHADYHGCERFKLSSSGVRPPETLLPNGKTLVVHEDGAEESGALRASPKTPTRPRLSKKPARAALRPLREKQPGR